MFYVWQILMLIITLGSKVRASHKLPWFMHNLVQYVSVFPTRKQKSGVRYSNGAANFTGVQRPSRREEWGTTHLARLSPSRRCWRGRHLAKAGSVVQFSLPLRSFPSPQAAPPQPALTDPVNKFHYFKGKKYVYLMFLSLLHINVKKIVLPNF